MKKKWIVFLLVLLAIEIIAFVFFGVASKKKEKPSAPSTPSTPTISHELKIFIKSEIDGYNPVFSKNNQKDLEKYLEEIHLREDGGVLYNPGEGLTKTKLDQIEIILTSEWQESSQVYGGEGNKPLASRSSFIATEKGYLMYVFVG